MTSVRRSDLDFTMLSTFQNCRKRYDYRINRGLVPKTKAMPLSFGGAIHEALNCWFTTRDLEATVKAFTTLFVEDLEVDDKRTKAMGEWILRNYALTYAKEPFTLVSSEQSFTLPLPNGNNFIGRIDKLIEWDGAVWVMDHKTTSQLGSQFMKQAEPNGQFTGYVWAARQLGHTKCVGVLLDAILIAKGLLPGKTRNASLTPLARFDAYRNDDHISEWMENMLVQHRDIRACEERGEWPMDGLFNGMCTYYGECPYRKLCIESPQVRERLVSVDYDVDFWDPRKETE